MIRFNDLKIKFQVLIKREGEAIEAFYFDNSTTAKEFAHYFNLGLLYEGNSFYAEATAVYNGAFPLED